MKWESFQSHLQSTNYDLYHTKQFADVTLVSDDFATFQAHKTVLSGSSKMIKYLLTISPNDQHPFLYLKDVMRQELEGFLQFIYLGEANISEDRIDQFHGVMRYFGWNEMSSPITSQSYTTKKEEPIDRLDFLAPISIGQESLHCDENEKQNLDFLMNSSSLIGFGFFRD